MARPKKTFNEKQMAQVEALASVLTIEQIADYFGIARNTFNAICERQPEVFEHYKRGKANAIGNVAKNLLALANDGNLTAIIFYLKTQAGWREKEEQSIGNQDNKPLEIRIVAANENQASMVDNDDDNGNDTDTA